jgi:hypothetical protein
MNGLTASITALNFKLNNPSQNQIKNSHHFHKGIWIAAGIFIVALLFFNRMGQLQYTKKAFEAMI